MRTHEHKPGKIASWLWLASTHDTPFAPAPKKSLEVVENALTEQCTPRLAVHRALDQLYPGDMALDLSIMNGQGESGLYSGLILFHAVRKAAFVRGDCSPAPGSARHSDARPHACAASGWTWRRFARSMRSPSSR